jgi:hypothetical protein
MHTLEEKHWMFIGFDEDSSYIYLDKNQISYILNNLNVTVICIPAKNSKTSIRAEAALKLVKSPDTLWYIELLMQFDTNQNICMVCEIIYKNKQGQVIYRPRVSTDEITWQHIALNSIEQQILISAQALSNNKGKEESTPQEKVEHIDKTDKAVLNRVKKTPNLSIDIIFNNPFRILGLYVNATEKEILKQANNLQMYAKMGKAPKIKTEFLCFPACDRTSESIEEAKKQIERSENRFRNSFFWYSNEGSINKLALDVLSEDKTEKALELWEKALDVEIEKTSVDKLIADFSSKKLALSVKDFSYAKNLIVLYLGLAFKENELNISYFGKAQYLAGRLFHSNGPLSQHAASIIGTHYRDDNGAMIAKYYIGEIWKCVKPLLDNNISNEALKEIAKSFGLFPDTFRKDAIAELTNKPIQDIKKKVEETAEKRNKNPLEANKYGKELYTNTYERLLILKDVLSTDNYQYQDISSKVADEIKWCSIYYFNKHRDEESNIDPGDDALKLAKYADSIGIDIRIKDWINTSMPILEEWVKNKPFRERRKKADAHIDYIVKQLKGLPDPDTVSSNRLVLRTDELVIADRFFENCATSLNSLKSVLAVDSRSTPSITILEQFENNENKWDEKEQGNLLKKIEDGKYVLQNTNEKDAYWSWGVSHLNFGKFYDFTFECSITKIKGPNDRGFGVVWSYQKKDDNNAGYFQFNMTGDGHYYFKEYNQGWVGGFQWTASEHVAPEDKTNVLTVQKRGNSVNYYINDKLIVNGNNISVENMTGNGIGFSIGPNITIGVNYLYFCNAYVSDFRTIFDYNYYMDLSSAVVSRTLDFCIAYANRTNDMVKPTMLMNKIRKLDMVPELKKRFDSNENILKNNMKIKEENTPALVKLFKKVNKWL